MNLYQIIVTAICFNCSLAAYQQKSDAFWNDLPNDLKKAEEILKAEKSEEGVLDYALFLFVFKFEESKEKIQKLLSPLIDKVKTNDPFASEVLVGKDFKISWSDESIIKAIRVAGLAITPYYVIPCCFVKAKPMLLDATEPQFGGNRDNFLPRCGGHKWGKGFIESFPSAEIETLLNRVSKAHDPEGGSIQFSEYASRSVVFSHLMFTPSKLLNKKTKISISISKTAEFKKALNALKKYYEIEFKMKTKDASLAAHNALGSLISN